MNIKQFLPRINEREAIVWKLWKWNNFQIELCCFRPFANIALHRHEHETIEIVHVFGKATYKLESPCQKSGMSHVTKWLDIGRFFSIRPNYWHGASVKWTGLVVLSCQWWDKKPTTVTEDLTYYASKT